MPHTLTQNISAFHSLSIRIKLLIIIIGICVSALVCSAVLETAFNWAREKEVLVSRLAITAEMIGLQSAAALEFVDAKAGGEDLAPLAADAMIRKACLYNDAGVVFASYNQRREDIAPVDALCPAAREQGVLFSWSNLGLYHAIIHNGRKIGSLYIERGLDDVYHGFAQQSLEKLGIVLAIIGLVWAFSFYFQRMISQPIMQLAAIARSFSQDRTQRVKAVKKGNDEVGALVDAFNEMTERIYTNEQQLSQAIEELTSSNTELERFAYSCSHDLQEPLRMISNYAALLEKNAKQALTPETGQYLDYITDGAKRMRELISGILSYARVGHQGEAMQRVDVNALVDYVLQNLNEAIKERGALVHKVGPMPVVYGNRTLLLQIFQNLISNAMKFCKTAPEIWVKAAEQPQEWEFSVRDNGIGIDPKYHNQVFEIFKRLNRREEYQGTGIGLAIFKKAVEYHGGRAWIESELGKGTTFFFTIPKERKS